jgi:predicted ribonuclease YlaK
LVDQHDHDVALTDTVVEPAFLWVPDHAGTSGVEAAEFAEMVGLSLDPEQRLALDVLLAEAAGGRWAALEAVLIAARQNLKTYLFRVITLANLYVFGTEFVVWTAHEFNTAMEAFRDVLETIDGNASLSRRVKRVNQANGEEGIEFTSGQRLRFKARTKTGGRGLTGDLIILDEAFALQPSHMGSLMPTLSAKSISGNPQILYGSSACQIQSDVLRSLRDRGRPAATRRSPTSSGVLR